MDEADKGRSTTTIGVEWVNISSGNGSPLLSQKNRESRKMVVCVCVCSIRIEASWNEAEMTAK